MQSTSLPKGSRLIFKGIIGSHSYNLATEKSDIDYTGVYIQSEEDILSNNYVEMVQVNPDEKYFELRKFLSLLSVANPNAIELLYLPSSCIEYCGPEFEYLISIKDSFLTKECGNTFSGYAKTQLRKANGLEKKLNWEKHKTERKNVLDFCNVMDRTSGRTYNVREWIDIFKDVRQEDIGLAKIDGFRDTFKVYINSGAGYRGIIKDDSTNQPRVSEIPKSEIKFYLGILYFNREAYSSHCKDFLNYQNWLKKRNVNRYVTNKAHGQTIDGKNIMHTVRLIIMARYIASNKTLTLDMTTFRKYLLDIKYGNINLEEVITEWTQKAKEIDPMFLNSGLLDSLPENFMKNLELFIRNYGKR